MPSSPPPTSTEQIGVMPIHQTLELLQNRLRAQASDGENLITSYNRATHRLTAATTQAASLLQDLESSIKPLAEQRQYLKRPISQLFSINVGGRVFEVSWNILSQYPRSLMTRHLSAMIYEEMDAIKAASASSLQKSNFTAATTAMDTADAIASSTITDTPLLGAKRAREGDNDDADDEGGVITPSDGSRESFRSCNSGRPSSSSSFPIPDSIVCDADGNLFFDRDPEIFEALLSVMRSSRSHVMMSPEKAEMVLHDAVFYQLEDLKLQKACVATADGTLELFFDYHAKKNATANMDQLSHLGPNINIQRSRFRSVYSVCPVGASFITGGEHTCTFSIKASEYVGVGMISEHCDTMDSEFHKVRNCCVFYMSGVLYSNYPHHEKRETNMKYGDGSVITISLNMDQRTIIFKINDGDPVIISCATAQRLRFAAVMKNQSSVQIEGGTTDSPGFDFSDRGFLPYKPKWKQVNDADGVARYIQVHNDDDEEDRVNRSRDDDDRMSGGSEEVSGDRVPGRAPFTV